MNCKGMFKGCRLTMLIVAAGSVVFNATAQIVPSSVEWQKTYGGTNDDSLQIIKPTGDGGYLLAGTSRSDASGNKTSPLRGRIDLFVVKINADGKREWDRSLGNGIVSLNALVTTPDGGFVLGGTAQAGSAQTKRARGHGFDDYWLMKFDGLGRKQWDHAYGGTGNDELKSVSRTSDGGYLLAGNSWSTNSGN